MKEEKTVINDEQHKKFISSMTEEERKNYEENTREIKKEKILYWNTNFYIGKRKLVFFILSPALLYILYYLLLFLTCIIFSFFSGLIAAFGAAFTAISFAVGVPIFISSILNLSYYEKAHNAKEQQFILRSRRNFVITNVLCNFTFLIVYICMLVFMFYSVTFAIYILGFYLPSVLIALLTKTLVTIYSIKSFNRFMKQLKK